MGRPTKTGLDYFPLDCNLDNKLKLIKAEFGMIGFGLIIRLYQSIYGDEGYFMEWSQDVALMFADQEKVGVNVVSEVVAACLRRGIFDSEMYEKHGVLTSRGIQKRYLKMTKKRTDSEISDEYILLSAPEILVYSEETLVSGGRNSVSDTRKYTKESKVNKSKVNDSIGKLESTTTDNTLFDLFEEEFARPLSEHEFRFIADAQIESGTELVKLALKEACVYGSKNINYVARVLANWKDKKFTPEDIYEGKHLYKNGGIR